MFGDAFEGSPAAQAASHLYLNLWSYRGSLTEKFGKCLTGQEVVEPSGIEPLTSSMPLKRSTN